MSLDAAPSTLLRTAELARLPTEDPPDPPLAS
jgi:hypothetical protein